MQVLVFTREEYRNKKEWVRLQRDKDTVADSFSIELYDRGEYLKSCFFVNWLNSGDWMVTGTLGYKRWVFYVHGTRDEVEAFILKRTRLGSVRVFGASKFVCRAMPGIAALAVAQELVG